MNRDKHIWEGWTVGDFIDDIEPIFDMSNHINRQPFTNKAELKQWVKDSQPYNKNIYQKYTITSLKNQDYNGNKITNKNYTTSRRLGV